MSFLDGGSLPDPSSTFIEAWISQVEDSSHWHDQEVENMPSPRTPSPSKKARTVPIDVDATPTQNVLASENSFCEVLRNIHFSLLEIALDEGEEDIAYENITQCRVYPELRDPDPFLKDAKVDYGIFIEPREGCRLYSSIQKFKSLNQNNRVNHV
ncbi:hypothetical protein NM208_g5201 [Fusarium decemcellulare]|uniref:Uncharacterized protein n=1 Tax=Fusarium decemcellulare TaxID=57161 RepID=A0ACC1SHW9_9HYPO|nr:hypothetical protein NM208_g5201 [Fusarium decemcellulare]